MYQIHWQEVLFYVCRHSRGIRRLHNSVRWFAEEHRKAPLDEARWNRYALLGERLWKQVATATNVIGAAMRERQLDPAPLVRFNPMLCRPLYLALPRPITPVEYDRAHSHAAAAIEGLLCAVELEQREERAREGLPPQHFDDQRDALALPRIVPLKRSAAEAVNLPPKDAHGSGHWLEPGEAIHHLRLRDGDSKYKVYHEVIKTFRVPTRKTRTGGKTRTDVDKGAWTDAAARYNKSLELGRVEEPDVAEIERVKRQINREKGLE